LRQLIQGIDLEILDHGVVRPIIQVARGVEGVVKLFGTVLTICTFPSVAPLTPALTHGLFKTDFGNC
jgi:hypothetical protein